MNYSQVLAALAVASVPLVVSDAAMAAKSPFQKTADRICGGAAFCSLSFSVPPGGRLEMINVSCKIRTDGSGIGTAQLSVAGSGQPLAPESHLPIERLATSTGEVVFTANQQTRLFAKAPETLSVSVTASVGVVKEMRCTITGDLRG